MRYGCYLVDTVDWDTQHHLLYYEKYPGVCATDGRGTLSDIRDGNCAIIIYAGSNSSAATDVESPIPEAAPTRPLDMSVSPWCLVT